jgi:hypothetical protein
VWHASVSSRTGEATPAYLRAIAEEALLGVGDREAGEWEEVRDVALHLRRRLTAEEAALVGPVVDVRGTWESQKRLARMEPYLPRSLWGVEQ